MTNDKPYNVALVAGPSGLTDTQAAEVKRRLAYITKTWQVRLTVPGLELMRPEVSTPPGIHAMFKHFAHVELAYLPRMLRGDAAAFLYAQLKDHDEVWCCPAMRGDARMTRATVGKLYHLAQGIGGPSARAFKLIPAWVEMVDKQKEN